MLSGAKKSVAVVTQLSFLVERDHSGQFVFAAGFRRFLKNFEGNTAMHDAAEAGSETIVKMLLDAGAHNMPDDFGVTPMILLADVAEPQHTRDAMKVKAAILFPYLKSLSRLYGATLVDKKMDLGAAVRIWNEAMTYGRPSGIATPIDVYDNLVELDSFSDIRNVVGDPDAIRMQVATSSGIFPHFPSSLVFLETSRSFQLHCSYAILAGFKMNLNI
uniref:ANK_REP_REGION domain-containing protein n=1 Tax=Parascaris equorum TaxID=6256 RepID=A0A914R7C7_PAREQ